MDDKMITLVSKMGLNDDIKKYCTYSKLTKIVIKDKEAFFHIALKTNWPLNIYEQFYQTLKETFNMYDIKLLLEVENMSEEYFPYYYRYYIEKYSVNSPILKMYVDNKFKFSDKTLTIEVSNKAEEMKLNTIILKLQTDLKEVGYDININIEENKQQNKEILDEIEADLKVKIPDDFYQKKEEPEEVKKNNFKSNFKAKPLIVEDKDNVVIGRVIDTTPVRLDTIVSENNNVTIECQIFTDLDILETKSGLKIITLKLTDKTDSIYGKVFIREQSDFDKIIPLLNKGIKNKTWFLMRGKVKNDAFSKELTIQLVDINTIERQEEEIIDDAPVRRVELHTHTVMSQMDGVVTIEQLIDQARKFKHRGLALTDHDGAQSFPNAFNYVTALNKNLKEGEEPFKMIYGTELVMIDDNIDVVIRPTDDSLMSQTYVVFDLETTGFNAGGYDSIIEIGAVKICNGEIIDRFDLLIDPKRPLPKKITELTNITDDMLTGQIDEESAVKKFIEWFKDLPMVAHNAKFDVSFIEMAYKKYNLGKFKNTVIDTLQLSRTLDNGETRHSLSAITKRYGVVFEEDAHHRADYDAEGTALVFYKMLKKLDNRNMEKISELNSLVPKDEIHKYGKEHDINILCLNHTGLKNLFKIISYANTTYLYKTPRILRSVIEKYREGLLIGSGCYQSEVFTESRTKSDEELANIIKFYDYVEVQPVDCYSHLVGGDFANEEELINNIKKVIRVTKESGKIIVATGDVHHLKKEDKIYRQIIIHQNVPGRGRHPLIRNAHGREIPSQHFRTTREMLDSFSFLDSDLAYEIVVTNTNKILDMTEVFDVIVQTGGVPFSPRIENSVETVNELVYGKAMDWYGNPLPDLIKERIESELTGIIKGGYDVIYLIAQKLVKKSNDDGYLVGSRGSVGSSFVATMMGITEVNPLPAHYRCPNCKHSIFEEDGISLGSKYSSGFDLPDLNCPKCQTPMIKDGQDMPFATFLGFNADKVPDIDLNFSGDYQWKAHEYTKVLFGVDNVYRAGTVGTVATKTAFGYVKGYMEDNHKIVRNAEVERLAIGCTGVKRTTGQHPGGIVVVPDYKEIFDFTPFQFPAEDPTSLWRTTHFDYHKIEDDLLKLDILGHDDPTMLRMLQDISGIDVLKIEMGEKETMKIFCSPEVLGVTNEQIMCNTGTLGIPEFGTKFVIQMLEDTKPKTFAELIKISGLSHGTDVWLGNAQELIQNKIVTFSDVIGCRDDIMVYLMYQGMEPLKAFKTMEFVRKGKQHKDKEGWKKFEDDMKKAGIPDWYITSCFKIKYMFPKAHAAAYVMSAFRIAWFKVHHPLYYYDAYFSVRTDDFDIETMIKGYDAIKNKMKLITDLGKQATNKDSAIYDSLWVALEATARGINFGNIDINRSQAKYFIIDDDNKTLIPPFRTIDGLGETVALKIVEEREKRPFLSIEDLQKRAKVSSTLIEKMRGMGILDNMDESSQLSLF